MMMQLKKLFTPVASMEAEEARTYMATHAEGTYLILDVRQPGEYREEHLPGARLMPLPQLHDAYKELDPEKPTIVQCAVGGRSRVAAQLLSGLGFREVYNLAGGILAFQGQKATGPVELNLDLARGDESPAEMIVLAYGMEKGLQSFYEALPEKTGDQELRDLAGKLARVEIQHEKSLFQLYGSFEPGKDQATFETAIVGRVMEGGFKLQEFMAQNAAYLGTGKDLLELAMMLETQALDLYLRLADKSAHPRTKEVLYTIAEAEKAHLASLGGLLEKRLAGGGGP
jgi:sulfur-carrier protein adenylyltransferase/sulfurtransferase